MLEIQCSLLLGLGFECHLLLNCFFWSCPFNYDEILLLGVGGFQFSLQSRTRSWFSFFGKTAFRSKSRLALGQWGLTMLLAFHNESNRGTVKIALVFQLSRSEWSSSFFSQVTLINTDFCKTLTMRSLRRLNVISRPCPLPGICCLYKDRCFHRSHHSVFRHPHTRMKTWQTGGCPPQLCNITYIPDQL